jgi:hypothetical protein
MLEAHDRHGVRVCITGKTRHHRLDVIRAMELSFPLFSPWGIVMGERQLIPPAAMQHSRSTILVGCPNRLVFA